MKQINKMKMKRSETKRIERNEKGKMEKKNEKRKPLLL